MATLGPSPAPWYFRVGDMILSLGDKAFYSWIVARIKTRWLEIQVSMTKSILGIRAD